MSKPVPTIQKYMTTCPETIGRDQPMSTAHRVMRERHIRHLPVLDGGHILFTLIEGARGKFLQREIYERVSVVGLAVVLLLFFVGLSNDIGKLS